MHETECLIGRSCCTAHRSDTRLRTSLSRVTPSAVSERLSELIGCPISCPFPLVASVLNQGLFPPLELPSFLGTTDLSVTPRCPTCPSPASGWSSPTTPRGFPCCARFPCVHAAASTPAQRLCSYLLNPTAVSVVPDRVVGSTCASSFSRLARRSLALRPAHSRRHQFVTLFTRRLQPYRYLHDRSGCFRLEPWPGGIGTCSIRLRSHSQPQPPLAQSAADPAASHRPAQFNAEFTTSAASTPRTGCQMYIARLYSSRLSPARSLRACRSQLRASPRDL